MAATAAAALLSTGLAACAPDEQSDDSDAQPPRRTPSPTATEASETGETGPTDEPTKGVGPRKGALRSPDILVFSKVTLTDDIIERIRKVRGVRSVEPLSMAQVASRTASSTWPRSTPRRTATTRIGSEPRGAVGPRRRRPARPREEAERTNPREERRAQVRWRPRRTACRSRRLRGSGAHRRRGRQRRGGRAARHAAGQRAARGDLPAASPRVGAQAHREDRRRQGVGPALDIAARLGLDISVQQTALLVGSVGTAVGIFNYTVLSGGHIAPEPRGCATTSRPRRCRSWAR